MYKLALIGFGNVGQGFARILQDKTSFFKEHFKLDIQIVAVSDLLKGSVYNPDGLDINTLLSAVESKGDIKSVDAPHTGWDALQTIRESNADVVVELSYTDLETGEPAVTHIRTALEMGKHVITTNKGPIALHYVSLVELAETKGLHIGFEGTVMSGTPTLQLGTDALLAAGIQRIEGILNGTTNYILTRMAQGEPYSSVLEEAQDKGYAEADPTGDVEGFDAAGKVVILANLLMGGKTTMQDVDRTGITQITPDDITAAQKAGKCWKLIGLVQRDGNALKLSVKPTQIPLDHPLASVSGATNAVTFTTDLLGQVTLIGAGAGRMETGYALVEDLLAIHRKLG